jgi:autophagy-related protein 13
MHQHPRPPPRMASPASSPTTNPSRTNNPREENRGGHARVSSEVPTYSEQDSGIGAGDEDTNTSTGPSREAVKKLDQIIQVPWDSHILSTAY